MEFITEETSVWRRTRHRTSGKHISNQGTSSTFAPRLECIHFFRTIIPWQEFRETLHLVHPIESPAESFALQTTIDLTNNQHVSIFEFDVFTRYWERNGMSSNLCVRSDYFSLGQHCWTIGNCWLSLIQLTWHSSRTIKRKCSYLIFSIGQAVTSFAWVALDLVNGRWVMWRRTEPLNRTSCRWDLSLNCWSMDKTRASKNERYLLDHHIDRISI